MDKISHWFKRPYEHKHLWTLVWELRYGGNDPGLVCYCGATKEVPEGRVDEARRKLRAHDLVWQEEPDAS